MVASVLWHGQASGRTTLQWDARGALMTRALRYRCVQRYPYQSYCELRCLLGVVLHLMVIVG